MRALPHAAALEPGDDVLCPEAGEAGRNGNSVGTYICDDLASSIIIRILPAPHPLQPSAESIIAQRSSGLTERVEAFTASVTHVA